MGPMQISYVEVPEAYGESSLDLHLIFQPVQIK